MKFQDSNSNHSRTSASVTHAQMDRQVDPWTAPNKYATSLLRSWDMKMVDGRRDRRQRTSALQAHLVSLKAQLNENPLFMTPRRTLKMLSVSNIASYVFGYLQQKDRFYNIVSFCVDMEHINTK